MNPFEEKLNRINFTIDKLLYIVYIALSRILYRGLLKPCQLLRPFREDKLRLEAA